jgi:hypothetical protein
MIIFNTIKLKTNQFKKRKLMKKLISTIAGLIVIIILATIVVGFVFWSRLPDIVAGNISKKLKVPVEIDSFGLSWGKIDAKKIQIGNPPKSILSRAFACNEIDLLCSFTNFLKTNLVIDEIDLHDVYLGLEFDSPTSTNGNWTKIMGNLKQSMNASPSPAKEKQKTASHPTNRTVLIHRIVLTNIDVDVVYKNDSGRVKKLPRIDRMELTEISSEGGVPMGQILNSVLGEMLKQIFIKENLKNMLQDLMKVPSPIQQYLLPFKGFFSIAPSQFHEISLAPLFHGSASSDREPVESSQRQE